MSFSKETKSELCTAPVFTDEQKTALVYGMLLFAKNFSANDISFSTESKSVATAFSQMLSSLTGAIVDTNVKLTRRGGEKNIYSLSVPDTGDCDRIFSLFGHSKNQPNLRINRANIDDDECIKYFLRGAFLVCGSVASPEKEYHLEFVVPHKRLSDDLQKIISEINELDISPKNVRRKGNYIVYIKGSENITDIITYMGGQMSSIEIIQSHIYKSVRNAVNRKTNSETANLKKTALAAAKQINAINIIKNKRGLEHLPDDLREIALIRLEFPEYNLREIGAALKEPISRSGVNHRIQRIIQIAEEISHK